MLVILMMILMMTMMLMMMMMMTMMVIRKGGLWTENAGNCHYDYDDDEGEDDDVIVWLANCCGTLVMSMRMRMMRMM